MELTESGFIEDPTRALRMLDAIAALGVSLSIDDFGTGYSSLSHLARMPVHEVKIDRSFVQGLESDPEFAPVVRSAIDMGHGLGPEGGCRRHRDRSGGDPPARVRLRYRTRAILYAKPMPLEAFDAGSTGESACRSSQFRSISRSKMLTDTVSLAVPT